MASSACTDAGLLRMKTVSLPRNCSLPRPRQICVGCASPATGTAALKAYDKLQSEVTGPQARKLIDTFAIVEYVATKGDIQGLQQGLKDEFDSLRRLLKDQRIEDMQLLKDKRSEHIQRLKDQRSEDIQRLKDQCSEDTQHRKDQHNELTQQYNQLRLWQFIFMTLAVLAFASVKPDTALGTILSFLPKLFGKP